MKLAVNYSPILAQLVEDGTVTIDVFKCPAWESVVSVAEQLLPTYVHLPLIVGKGIGTAWNSEKKAVVAWDEVDRWLERTDTPYVNLHLETTLRDYPQIPRNSKRADHIEFLVEHALGDIAPVVERYGKERVMVENLFDDRLTYLRPTYLPEFISTVIEEAGCGMLLDVSHARLAAERLNMDYVEYFAGLPTHTVRELHLTGIQTITMSTILALHNSGASDAIIQQAEAKYLNQRVDHLPMTSEDWKFWEWAMIQVRSGRWGDPWCVGYEVGGVGALWEYVANIAEFEVQIPRLYTTLTGNE
jgi:uncharacterized protein (UPF0276 family)